MKKRKRRKLNTVRLTRGRDRVIFTTAKGTGRATMANSEGEFAGMSVADARRRVRTLLRAGWRVKS